MLLYYRGGILEPEGMVEIKYRKPALVQTIHRLDPKCKELMEELATPDLAEVSKEVCQWVDYIYPTSIKISFAIS